MSQSHDYVFPNIKLLSDYKNISENSGLNLYNNFPAFYKLKEQFIKFNTLYKENNFFVLGEPGYGKSRLLQELVLNSRKNEKEAFYFDLKKVEFSYSFEENIKKYSSGTPDVDGENILKRSMFKTSGFNLKNEASCLICLDALDEVKGQDFSKCVERLDDFIKRFNRCQIIISCRTHHLDKYKNELFFSGFKYLVIHSFSGKQIADYLKRAKIKDKDFTYLFELTKVNDKTNIIRIPRYLKLIIELIVEKEISEIQNLSKHFLFERFIYHKLETEYKNHRDIDIHTVKRVLEKIALVMEIQQSNSISKDDLLTCFDDIKSNLSQTFLQTVELKVFYDHTVLKDNIDQVEFENTEFQEYLAAKEIKRLGRTDQVSFELAVCAELDAIYPSWFNVLGFLLDMDISLLPALIKCGKKETLRSPDYFKLILKIDNEKLKCLTLDERKNIFKTVFSYHQKAGHWISAWTFLDMPQQLCYYYDSSLMTFIKDSMGEQYSDGRNPEIRKGNAILIIKELIAKDLLSEEEKKEWKKLLIEFAKADNSAIARYSIAALGEYKDLSLIKRLEYAYKSQDKYIVQSFLQALVTVDPEDYYSIGYFLEGMQQKELCIVAVNGLVKLKSYKAISLFFNYFIENSKFQNSFFYHESSFSEAYRILFENIRNIIDENIIELLKQLMLKIVTTHDFKLKNWISESGFMKSVCNIIKKWDRNFFEIVLNQLVDSITFYELDKVGKILFYLYDPPNLKSFAKIVKEKERVWIFINIMQMFYNDGEDGMKIYKAGRKSFRKEFRLHEKNKENSSKQNEAMNKKLYQEFKSNLLQKDNTNSIELFQYYLYRREVLYSYFIDEDKERFKYLVEQFLEKVNSEKMKLTFYLPEEFEAEYFKSFLKKSNDSDDNSKLKMYYKKQDNKYYLQSGLSTNVKNEIKEILKNYGIELNQYTVSGTVLPFEFSILIRLLKDNSLGIKFEKYRRVFIHYIPFLTPNECQGVLGLLGDLSDVELDILVDIYSEKRDDDLAELYPQNLAELTLTSKSPKALNILKKMIFKQGINPHQKIRMLRVISKFKEEEEYFKKVFKEFEASEDKKIIAKEVNEILITKYENNEAIRLSIDRISSKINRITEDNNNEDVAEVINQYTKPLAWVSLPEFLLNFLDLLSLSFRLFEKGDDYLWYANKILSIVISYFQNLKKFNTPKYLIKLENHINKNHKKSEGFNLFNYKLLDLKKAYLAYLGQNRPITECIYKYNQLKTNQYLPITSSFMLYEMIKEIIDTDLKKWVEEERAYAFIEYTKNKQEDLIQKTLITQLENCFLKKGFRQSDMKIHREVQSYDDKRPDFLISYGFIPPVVIEVKRLNNKDITNSRDRVDYKEKLHHYLSANQADYGIYLIFKTEYGDSKKSHIQEVKELYKENENIEIMYLDCIRGLWDDHFQRAKDLIKKAKDRKEATKKKEISEKAIESLKYLEHYLNEGENPDAAKHMYEMFVECYSHIGNKNLLEKYTRKRDDA